MCIFLLFVFYYLSIAENGEPHFTQVKSLSVRAKICQVPR